eukprot:4835882-Pleurochrysis_carterae.AAC.1
MAFQGAMAAPQRQCTMGPRRIQRASHQNAAPYKHRGHVLPRRSRLARRSHHGARARAHVRIPRQPFGLHRDGEERMANERCDATPPSCIRAHKLKTR